jgi:hypothetical protein
MNVGNADFFDSLARAYVYKVKSCAVLDERVALLKSTVCDSVVLIELLGDDQCRCACDDEAKDAELCEAEGWVPDEPRCSLCMGCGTHAPSSEPGCLNQAAVVCPSDFYDVACSTSADPRGCDCLCRLKLDQHHSVNDETMVVLQPPDGCDLGQQAICATRRHPMSGAVVEATCLIHPSHCTGVLGTDEDCIAACHTPLVKQAFDFVTSWPQARQLVLGDWNCGAAGECDYPGPDYCMWESILPSYGLEKCPFGDTPTAQPNWLGITPCILDFAVSNRCPSCDERVLPVTEGDHALVVVGEDCEP